MFTSFAGGTGQHTVFVFFWEVFRFRNEQNIIPFIQLPIAE